MIELYFKVSCAVSAVYTLLFLFNMVVSKFSATSEVPAVKSLNAIALHLLLVLALNELFASIVFILNQMLCHI